MQKYCVTLKISSLLQIFAFLGIVKTIIRKITLFFNKNIVFPAQDEYSYLSADFRLKEARNSFHFPQTSFTNSFPNTVWFIVSNLPQT